MFFEYITLNFRSFVFTDRQILDLYIYVCLLLSRSKQYNNEES